MCHIEFLIGALCDPDRPLVQEIILIAPRKIHGWILLAKVEIYGPNI